MFTELAVGFSCLFPSHCNGINTCRNSLVPKRSKLVKKCYAILRSGEVRSWKLGEKQAKFQHLFCRTVYLILWTPSLVASGEAWRAMEAREAGRHSLLQIFRFWKTVGCSPELSAQAQICLRRHEMLAKVRYSLPTAACLPQTRVQLSTVQGTALGCTACGSRGDLHCSTWNGQSGLHRHEGAECNAQYGSGSLNSHRFLCSIPTRLLPSWEVKRYHRYFYLLSVRLPGQAALSIHYFCDETTR